MTKDVSELMTECWQLLVEYIPRRDHTAAAEQFFSYLYTVLSKEELEAIAELDSDLSEAYSATLEEDEYFDEEDEEDEEDY